MNNVPHYAVMRAMQHLVVNIMVVTLFGEGWTNEQRHRHGESSNNFLLHLHSPWAVCQPVASGSPCRSDRRH
jgi:hypothetical protein